MPRREKTLSTRESCRLLKIGRAKLYRLVQERGVRCARRGEAPNSPLRLRRSDLMTLLRPSPALQENVGD